MDIERIKQIAREAGEIILTAVRPQVKNRPRVPH